MNIPTNRFTETAVPFQPYSRAQKCKPVHSTGDPCLLIR